ncbi:MAG: TrbG/VirB9 family P-type conjugative transfer protein [Bacteroides sp.]|nr:TrbG/VirB9 family P-type conjugative transfer protein [Prevotella sp.]MCM1407022.1 TrbG/VirB9 family P-type conjugative transfer protein [Treponema brennaborense]MCM1470174.1 TrbG/VirB9 family P-type conjugative transfer protein [Bacteroides sp.]
MKKNVKNISIVFTVNLLFVFVSCQTVDLEKQIEPKISGDETLKSLENEKERNEEEMHEYFIQEEVKVQDIAPTVVYIEKPVYVPFGTGKEREKKDTGIEASKASLEKATIKPENYKDGTFYYTYNENFVYEIYAQPYHLTDIILEDGEVVLGNPLLSEDESVWELTANVAKNPATGDNIQHLFIKPAYSGLDSSFIVITDRRVYHMRIKSFKDTHMAMVKFTYPNTKNVWARSSNDSAAANGVSIENDYITVTNPEYLSFDYKMKYGFKKPEFLPQRVYDDGNKTYIVVDDIVLHKQLPLVFNERNEIVNYAVKKNVFIIPRLINKIILRLENQKVTIEKKQAKARKINIDDEQTENRE